MHCLSTNSSRRGAILMEVVLALALFFLAGAVIYGGLSACLSAADRVRLQAQAADLAVSKLSEMQLGELDRVSDGPNAYTEEDLAGWTWEIAASPLDIDRQVQTPDVPAMVQVQIVIRNEEAGIAHRLTQLFVEEKQP